MINYINRETGKTETELTPGEKLMEILYSTIPGKLPLELLVKRKIVSSLMGKYMSSKLSRKRISKFINDYSIDMSLFVEAEYENFNQFFARKIKPECRPIGENIVSPADGKIMGYQNVSDINKIFVKGTEFTLSGFLQNSSLTEKYKNGSMLIVRLAPVDYHRFHFPADGKVSKTETIKGDYYSVSPIALKEKVDLLFRNKRTISTLTNEKYGDILISEVGATMVGSIIQTYDYNQSVKKGKEKGD